MAYMLTPSDFLGHIIPYSIHVASSAIVSGRTIVGMFLLSSNHASSPLIVLQPSQAIPATIQVGTTSVPLFRGQIPSMGRNPPWGKTKPWGKTPPQGSLQFEGNNELGVKHNLGENLLLNLDLQKFH